MSDEAVTDVPAIPAAPTGNVAMRTLVVLGAIALLAGALMGFFGNAAAKHAEDVNGYLVALEGPGAAGSPAIDAGYAWMWAGIVVAILGALMLIGALVVSAARGSTER